MTYLSNYNNEIAFSTGCRRDDGLAAAFRSANAWARGGCGARLSDICIDATAGQKIFGIAAAVVTLNRSLVFTGVNNQGVVRAFDAGVSLGGFA